MADEKMEGNSPMSTSEATPPHVDNSPEMISQPSPPEEQRVSSSTDGQPSEVADSPVEQRISSTSDLEQNDGPGSSSRLSAAEILLIEANEAGTVEGGSPPSLQIQSYEAVPEIENQPQPDAPPDLAIRLLLEAPPVLPRSDEQFQPTVEGALMQAGLVRAAVGSPLVQTAIEKTAQVKSAVGAQVASTQEISDDAIKRNTDEEKLDSNDQFDVDDSSSPENVDLGSDSSPMRSDDPEAEKRDSVSIVAETAILKSDSSSRIGAAIEEKENSGIGATETIVLESELSPSKTDLDMLVSGRGAMENTGLKNESSPSKSDSTISVSGSGMTKNVPLRSELSPSKTKASRVDESGSTTDTPERGQEVFSPKRKSPRRFQH